MRAKMAHLQKRDIAVLILCAAILISTLGAVGASGRRRAKELVCQANLHQWFGIFQGYIAQNGGTFIRGGDYMAYNWVKGLKDEDKDWKRLRIWLCPEAEVPGMGDNGKISARPSVFAAWGAYVGFGPTSIAGSYGVNGYIIPLSAGTYEGGVPGTQGWYNLREVPDASNVPMFVDALRFDMWPLEINPPASNEFAAWSGSNSMSRCCINRHNGAVNCLFVDGSVRKVGLKELWTLKWHKSFNTAGPWTRAGGVQPEDWPAWIRPFKDY
jgi:prepilin-type processing-associated H-X9-DG protein